MTEENVDQTVNSPESGVAEQNEQGQPTAEGQAPAAPEAVDPQKHAELLERNRFNQQEYDGIVRDLRNTDPEWLENRAQGNLQPLAAPAPQPADDEFVDPTMQAINRLDAKFEQAEAARKQEKEDNQRQQLTYTYNQKKNNALTTIDQLQQHYGATPELMAQLNRQADAVCPSFKTLDGPTKRAEYIASTMQMMANLVQNQQPPPTPEQLVEADAKAKAAALQNMNAPSGAPPPIAGQVQQTEEQQQADDIAPDEDFMPLGG